MPLSKTGKLERDREEFVETGRESKFVFCCDFASDTGPFLFVEGIHNNEAEPERERLGQNTGAITSGTDVLFNGWVSWDW